MTLDITEEMVIAFLVVLRYFQSKMGFIYKRSQLRIMLIGQCRCSLRIQPHKVLCQFPSVNMHLLMTTPSKGQVISKGFFGVFNFFQKTNKNTSQSPQYLNRNEIRSLFFFILQNRPSLPCFKQSVLIYLTILMVYLVAI